MEPEWRRGSLLSGSWPRNARRWVDCVLARVGGQAVAVLRGSKVDVQIEERSCVGKGSGELMLNMGQQVAKHVFKPGLPTYSGTDGEVLYVRQRLDGQTDVAAEPLIWLTTLRGNEIPADFLKARSEAPQFTLLLSHGNMEDLGIAMMQAAIYSEFLDCNVLVYDYTVGAELLR